MKSDLVRKEFNDRFTYADFGSKEMGLLRQCIYKALKEDGGSVGMKLSQMCKRDYQYKQDGSLKEFYFRVDGIYFKKREAISFNPDGFIGFAGWADSRNEAPFHKAFKEWLSMLFR